MPSSTISIRVNGQWDGAALQSAIKDLESFGKTAKSSIGLYTSNAQKLAVETASLGDSVSKALTQSGTDMVKFGNNLQRAGNAAQDLGRQLTTSLTLPLVGVGTYAGAMAVQYDTAMANVRKVTDMTEAELDQLGESALELSTKQPVSAETILNVEALGAQLGIADNMLESFAQTVTGLDIATNLSADQAATDMARFANITGMADDKYQNFGSTIVALGNNLATTESEIANMSLRLAAAGDIAGMSEADILGMAGAMSSLGIRAEAGGSAMTTIMSKISKAVADGGSDLEAYAQVAGMSAGQFASAWQSAPMDAIISLLDGIKRLDEGGQDMNVTLSELGINEIRQSDAMRRLANDTGILKDAVNLANTAWQENTALTDEVSQRNESMASRLQVLKNRVDEIAINVGGPLVNALIDALDACQPLIDAVASAAQAFADADAGTQQMILGLAGLAAGAGPVINVMGKLSTGVGSVISSLGHAVQNIGVYNDALTTTDGAHVRNYQSADTFAARVGLLDNAILKASGDTDAYVRAWELAYDAQHRGAEITEQLAVLEGNLGNASGKTRDKIEAQIDSLNRQYATANKTYDENRRLLDGWADMASQATKTEVSVTGLGSSFTDMAESAGDAAKESKKSGTAMKSIKSGASLAAASIGSFIKQAALMGGVTIAITAVTAAIGYLVNAAIEAEEHQKLLTSATRDMSDIMSEAAVVASESASSMSESFFDAAEAAEDALTSLSDLNDQAVDTLSELGTNSAMLDTYLGTIEELANQSGLTASEQERLKQAVEGYNTITGASVEVTDAASGSLSVSTDELRENAAAWIENAEAQAYQELANQYLQEQLDNQQKLKQAQDELAASRERLADANLLNTGLGDLIALEEEVRNNQQAVDDLSSAADAARENYEAFSASAAVSMSSLAENVRSAVSSLPADMQMAGLDIASSLSSGIESGSLSVEQAAQFITEGVGGTIANLPPEMRDAGMQAAQSLADSIASGELTVDQACMILSAAAIGEVSTLPAELQPYGTQAAEALGSAMSLGSALAGEGASELNSAASSALGSLPGDLAVIGSSAAGNLSANLAAGVPSAGQSSQSLADATRSGVGGLPASMGATGSSASSSFASGVGSGVGATRESANSLSSAASEMGNGDSWTWGNHLAGNFASGIGAAYSRVVGAASSIARAAASMLKFTVPEDGPWSGSEKGGFTSGTHLVENFAEGMRAAMPNVSAAANSISLAAALPPTMAPYQSTSFKYAPSGNPSNGLAGTTNVYQLTINGERKGSMSAAALEAVEVLFNEFGLTSEMGVQ